MSLFGGKTQASTETVASGVTIQTSIYGSVVPVVYGQTRLTGNLIWYGGFQSIPPSSGGSGGGKGGGGSGGKSGSSSNSTTYKASFIFALAEGTLGGVSNVWSSKAETAFGASNLSFTAGGLEQGAWGYLTTNFAGQNLSYAGTGYVYAAAYDLGTSAQLPNLSYEVTGLFPNAISGLPDADPRDIVVDVLTNPRYGIGFPPARLGDLSVFSNYCRAAGMVVSPLFDTQQDAASQVNQIVQDCNAEFVWSGAALTIVPYGDVNLAANGATYTAPTEALFSLTDDDFLDGGANGDPVQVSRARPSDRMNSVKLEWLNRSNQYNIEIVEAKDQAAIETYGLRTDTPSQSRWFCDLAAATMSATLQLQRQAVRNQYSFTLGWRYCLLDPMDLIEITDANLGFARQLCRIVSIEEDDTGNLAVVAEDYLHGSGSAPLYSYQSGSPYLANYNAPPGPVNAPLIFEPPPAMLAANSITAPQILVGASGGANWGGCDVWLSLDGSTYQRMGRIVGPARQGLLRANLPAGPDPDTIDTLSVDLSESGGVLLSGTLADANAFRTLCYVDGELMAYETAVLTGGNLYALTTLRRGVYGSAIAAHAAGTEFCRLDDNILWVDLPVRPVSYVGQTLYLKFLSFNLYGGGQESLASVSAYTYNPNGAGEFVYPPSAVSFTVGAEQQQDGTWNSFGVVAWTASPDPFFDQYEVQYRLHDGPGPWIGYRCGPNTTSFRISPLPANTAYDVQVRAVRSAGPFYSAWAQDLNVATIGKTTPPPAPTALSAAGGYRQITLDWIASAENDIAWYEIWESGDSTEAHASRIGLITGTHYVRPGLNLNDQRWYWLRAQDTSGNFSAFAGPATATTYGVDSSDITGQIVAAQIAANSIAASNLISGLNVVQSVSTISAANHTTSLFAYAADTQLLYQYKGGAWVSVVSTLTSFPAVNITGELTAGQIASLAATQITGQLTASQIASLEAPQITGQLTAAQIASLAATQITGQLTASQIASLEATQITGQLTAAQIASLTAAQLTGQITTTQIAPDSISTALLQAGAVESANIAAGAIVASKLAIGASLITDPYLNDPSYWTLYGAPTIFYQGNTYLSNDMGGTNAATFNLGSMTAGLTIFLLGPLIQISPNTAYSLSCQVWAYANPTQPLVNRALIYQADGTTLIAAPGVDITNVAPYTATGGGVAQFTFTTAANAAFLQVQTYVYTAAGGQSGYWLTAGYNLQSMVGTTLIQDGAVTTNQIAANTITGGNIAANTITGANILAGTITATEIAAGTITGANIAAGTITAANIEAGTITGTQIAASTITGSNIAADTITAANILAGTITGTQIAASTITGANIAAATITAANIVAGTITSTQIAANTITGGDIAANTITGGNIAAGTITASNIEAGTIEAAQIATGGITGTNIAGSTITGSNIAALTITGANIAGGTITGDKITGNFFQGYQYTASSGTGATTVMYGGLFTNAGLTYGPYFAHNDASGVTRAVLGHWAGADGLWIYDASGNLIWNVDQLASGVVQTSMVAANAITSSSSANNSGGSTSASNTSSSPGAVTNTVNLASITVTADGSTTLNIDISVLSGLALAGNYQYTSELLLYRDGANSGLLTITPSAAASVATFVQDTPAAGSHTYTLVLYAAVGAYTTPTGVTHMATAAAGPNTIQIQQFKR
jgi:hypothetical protein